MSDAPKASVIIPAHNEAQGIGRTLTDLLADADPDEFAVVVVCNGCSDATAEVARRIPTVTVVELQEASKIAALRAGDRRSDVFPRIYLDADVVLNTAAARAMATALQRGEGLVAGMRGRYALDAAPLVVQLYYEFRQRLPVFADGIIGAGVYAMSEEGRARFEEWPDVLGDDQFIFRLFAPEERVTVRGHATEVEPAPTLQAVVRRGIRVRRGNQELASIGGVAAVAPPRAGVRTALLSSLTSPRGWASIIVFVSVAVTIRIGSRLKPSPAWA